MILKVFADKIQLGQAAAEQAARAISQAIAERGQARIIAATGASQFEFLKALIAGPVAELETEAPVLPVEQPEDVTAEGRDDHSLLAAILTGDEVAFQELVRRYKDQITNYIHRMLNDHDRAVDLAQETFVRIYKNADRYQATYNFSTYIYRIAHNLAISELRQRKRRQLIPLPSYLPDKENKEIEVEIDWQKVEMFHLDEYVGLPITHPASFRKYLLERFVRPAGIEKYHLLDGESEPQEVCRAVGQLISAEPIDIAFVGVGENSHLAFNDPPADFEIEEPYIVVNLDEACRRQQVGEGWFASLDDVPSQAISMSIQQILKAKEIICIVPDARKAEAVRNCFEGEISPLFPASILRMHANTTVYLDAESSSLLKSNLDTN